MRLLAIGFSVLISTVVVVAPPASAQLVESAADLESLVQEELDAVFAGGSADRLPHGSSRGTALAAPGDLLGAGQALLAPFAWQGKVFDARFGLLYNRILGGIPALPARVYIGESILDGAPVIVVNYSGTRRRGLAPFDELRLVGPGLYLGMGYVRTIGGYFRASNFVLDFND